MSSMLLVANKTYFEGILRIQGHICMQELEQRMVRAVVNCFNRI